MSKLDTFKKQQALKARLAGKPLLHKVVPKENVDAILQCGIDESRLCLIDYGNDLTYSLNADQDEIRTLLSELGENFNKERIENIMAKTQHDLLYSIAVPFGLGKLLSAHDKIGGNVDTIHNARAGVYATDEEALAYESREKYDTDRVHKHKNYQDRNRDESKARKSDGALDGYSGKTLGKHDKANLDHIVSGRQTHDDPGRVLAEVKTEELSNIPENLTLTSESINKSKKAKSPEKFASYLVNNAPQRSARLQELREKQILTDKENKELKRLNELERADPEKIKEKGENAQDAQDKILNYEYYSSDKFFTNTLGTSLTEGGKMAAQQAFGLILIELFTNSFLEIRSSFSQGLEGESLRDDISIRLKRIGNKILAKWKDFFEGGVIGLISGFISNILTIIINVFITSGKRLVRMIREGIFSLLKALKTLLCPPEGMSYRDAAHAAMKLVVAGGLIVAGVALEEIIEKSIISIPFLMPIAPVVTAVIVGSITVILAALLIYLVDKLDLLGAVRVERDKCIIESLDNSIKSKLQSCERIAIQIDAYIY